MFLKNRSRGFTLIELLVVIAIIGILASVVLASLNNARDKGEDANIKQQLSSIRAEAELSYDDRGRTYAFVCTDVATLLTGLPASVSPNCDAVATQYAVEAQLSTNQYFCVDYTGQTTTTAATKGATATVCP